MPLTLVTWNVNSLKARMPRVLEFLSAHRPDVVCLQETKCNPGAFPALELEAAGYASIDASGGRWAGVAVLARRELEPEPVAHSLPGAPNADEARWIEVDVAGLRVVSVYVINGRTLTDPMFEAKLAFLDAMAERCEAISDRSLVVSGDFNIAPADADVYDPAAFEGSTHVTSDERSRLRMILESGRLVDAYRHLHPGGLLHTWWDYRAGHFHRGLGLRIDLTLVSERVSGTVTDARIEREFRKGKKPSDHAPFVVVMERPEST